MGTQGRLQDKVAVITGAASGIGAGTVRRFIEEGAKVIIADIQDEPGLALAKEFGANARYIHTDVTNEDQVAAAVDLAVKEFGRIDIMFNNACNSLEQCVFRHEARIAPYGSARKRCHYLNIKHRRNPRRTRTALLHRLQTRSHRNHQVGCFRTRR
ncbi:MAG: hypothetical protein RL628_1018 [Actinomycetota bacterium]